MFYSSGKALKKLDADWTTLTAYGGSKIRQFGIRIIKCFWNKKWKFLFHIVDATGPILLGLKTPRCMGIFVKHSVVYIETIDMHSMIQHRLASQQIKKGRMRKIRLSARQLLRCFRLGRCANHLHRNARYQLT